MKTIFYILFFAAFAVAGCTNQPASKDETHDHGDGSTHTHENGETHQHHDTVQQQEFTVDPDTAIQENHHHADDSTHSHPH